LKFPWANGLWANWLWLCWGHPKHSSSENIDSSGQGSTITVKGNVTLSAALTLTVNTSGVVVILQGFTDLVGSFSALAVNGPPGKDMSNVHCDVCSILPLLKEHAPLPRRWCRLQARSVQQWLWEAVAVYRPVSVRKKGCGTFVSEFAAWSGAIVGIAVGCAVGAILIILLLVALFVMAR
jgi:hypothetical protein